MNKPLQRFAAFLIFVILVAACVSPLGTGDTQSPSSDQVETIVASTLQAMSPQGMDTPGSTPEPFASLLPHRLYFLSPDNQGITQVYRMEQDGSTKTQLSSESANVTEYDVSWADASLAFVANNQLVLANADGSNRRVVVDGSSNANADLLVSYNPVFSPDGQTLAYAHNGLNLYSMSTGASNLMIEDQMEDVGNGLMLPIETYSPEKYSPDGTKLLLALGHWEVAPSHAVYDPVTDTLVRYENEQEHVYCCSFHGGPAWSPDGSSFYGVASAHDFAYKSGELWKVDAANGAVSKLLTGSANMINLPKEPYLAPNGYLYIFLGTYGMDTGFFDAPVLQMVRSASDGVTDRTVLRNENFVMMNEALWAPDASFVIVSTAVGRDWDQEGGVLALYPTDGQKDAVWLAPFGNQMKWGP